MSQVSVIIPAYNGAKFLPRSIGSVLAQTFTDWELIVVDDGSTDNTREVVEAFCKKDPRIHYFYEENSGGPARPKNTAFAHTRGEYIAYLDQDDEWLPEKLEKQVAVFENDKEKKLGLVACGAYLVDQSEKIFAHYVPRVQKDVLPEILLRNPIYSNSSVLIRREVVTAVGPRDEKMRYSEDWDMWIRIADSGYEISLLEALLFKYYFHENNTTVMLGGVGKVADAEYVFTKHRSLYEKYRYVHVGFFRLGVMFFLAGKARKSRVCFCNSVAIKKTFLPAYGGYVLSFLGKTGGAIIRGLIWGYRVAHGKTYLLRSSSY